MTSQPAIRRITGEAEVEAALERLGLEAEAVTTNGRGSMNRHICASKSAPDPHHDAGAGWYCRRDMGHTGVHARLAARGNVLLYWVRWAGDDLEENRWKV